MDTYDNSTESEIKIENPANHYKEDDINLPKHTKLVLKSLLSQSVNLNIENRVTLINELRKMIHDISPFKENPVDLVSWVKNDLVHANDYNPNSVAPPEMELLRVSISKDGYTQPIVTTLDGNSFEVIDGFHRHRVGKECSEINSLVLGYLPVVKIRDGQTNKTDRMASTIRHNRARGKHKVESMSDIVVELKKRNWSDEKICKNLGMEQDEVLRLCQISGLSELFSDQEFSKSWDVEGDITESDFIELTDDIDTYGEEVTGFRTVNTSDENRIFHTYEHWECYKAGFYATTKQGMTKDECEKAYMEFLSDDDRFSDSLAHVISEWKNSCEHYLSNISMNRIAWLGQAAACYSMGIPSTYRGGFNLLTPQKQDAANNLALIHLNIWLERNGRSTVTMAEAVSGGRQSDIY